MKYKLIKSYPGSPKLGTEVSYSETHQIYNFNGGDFYSELPKNQVENLPEFWEKVKEETYKVLEYRCNLSGTNIVGKLEQDGLYHFTGAVYSPCHTVSNINYNIHSVKRLSDGEVFTVGEEVDDFGTKRVITRFSDEKGWVTIPVIFDSYRKIDLTDIKKVKKPLFITEDGVEKFEGDTITSVNVSTDDNENYTIRFADIKVIHFGKTTQEEAKKHGVLWFSTKESAEEYILMNKPCLSINDIMKAGYGICSPSPLIKIVKEKNDSK